MTLFYRFILKDVIKLLLKGKFTMSQITELQAAVDEAIAHESQVAAAKQTAADATAALATKQAELDAANAAMVEVTAKLVAANALVPK